MASSCARVSISTSPSSLVSKLTDTVTVKDNDLPVFEPAASVAVTVMTACPSETAVTVTSAPEMLTVATEVADEEAWKVRTSPSASRKSFDTSTIRFPSATRNAWS